MKPIKDLEFGKTYVYYFAEDNEICISTWFKDFVIDEEYNELLHQVREYVYASSDLKWTKNVILLGEL